MKRMLSWGMVSLFAFSMVWVYASPAWAGEGSMDQGSMAQSGCPMIQASRTPEVSGMVGALVANRQNEELGRVIHVTYGPDGGINFLIVSSCLPGMSGRLVGVPYRSFDNYPEGKSEVTLNLSTEDFKNAPSFTQDSWPNGVDRDWAQKAYEYFESTQYFG